MLIQTENTPNPLTLKFLPGETVMEQGVAEFKSMDEAAGMSHLAQQIFQLGDVTGVFFGSDFVSVTKEETAEWGTLKTRIMAVIMEHFTIGQPLFHEGQAPHEKNEALDDDDELTKQIKELLDQRVRPMVAMDGGDIVFDRFEEGIVYLTMRGACAGCPSSTMTLKGGIENMLRHYVPEVLEVRSAE